MSKIFLDFGHGGSDSGAVSGGLVERDINLIIGTSCANELERHGVSVRKSRTSNSELPSLFERCAMANNWGADYFASIHCNAGGGDRGEVIHSIHRGKGLQLSNSIAAEMKNHGQSTVKEYDKRGDNNKDYYAVIRGTAMDAVIVECAFLDNETDNDIIDTYGEQVAFGVAIARGILNHLGITIKQSISQPNIQYGIVTADVLNVRAGRGTNYDIWDTLKQNTKVELGELNNGWYLVYYNNGKASGYVSAQYIKKD